MARKGKKAKAGKVKKATEVEPNQIEIGSKDLQTHHSEIPIQSLVSDTTVSISESQPKDLACDLSSEASESQDIFNSINPYKISSFNAEIQSNNIDYANDLNRKVESPLAKNENEPDIISSQGIGTHYRDTHQNAPNIMISEGLTASDAQTKLATPTCKFEELEFDRVATEYAVLKSVKDMKTEAHNRFSPINSSLNNPGLSAIFPRVSPSLSGGSIENLMAETASIFPPDEDPQFSTSLSTEVKGSPAEDMSEFIKASMSNNEAPYSTKSQTSEEMLSKASNLEMLMDDNNLNEARMGDTLESAHVVHEVNHIVDSKVKIEDRRNYNETSLSESTLPKLDAQRYTYPSTETLKEEDLSTLSDHVSQENIDCMHNLVEKVSQATWTEVKEIAKMVTNEAISQTNNNHEGGDLFDLPKHLLESTSAELTSSATNLLEHWKKTREPMTESIKVTAVDNEPNTTSHSSKPNTTDQEKEGDLKTNQDSKKTFVGNTVKISPDTPIPKPDNTINAWELDKTSNNSVGTGLDELISQEKPNTENENESSVGPNNPMSEIISKLPHTSFSRISSAERENPEAAKCYFKSLVDDDEPINSKMSTTAQIAQDDILREKYTSKKSLEQATSCIMEANKYFPTVNGISVTEDFTSEVPKTLEMNEETKFEHVDADQNTCSSHQIVTGFGTGVSRITLDEYSSSVSEIVLKDADFECHNSKGVVSPGTTKYIAGNSMLKDEANNQSKILPTMAFFVSKGQVPESSVKETTKILTESKIQVVEQVPDMELVTMSKKSLDLLHQRLDDMEKEIQNLTAVITSQSLAENSMESNIFGSASNQLCQSAPEPTPKSTSNEDTTVVSKPTTETKTTSPTKRNGIWDAIWPFGNTNSETRTKSSSGTENSSQSMLSQQVDSNRSYSLASPPKKYKVIGRVGAKHERPINAR